MDEKELERRKIVAENIRKLIKENYTFCKLFLVITVFLLTLHKLCSIINL